MIHKPSILDIQSFTQQGLEAGYFNFGKAEAKGTDYFNCAILNRPDGDFLVTRRALWDKRDSFGYNDIMAFSLNGLKPHMGFKVQIGQQFPNEHFEDPRAIYHDGRTFISACNFVRDKKGMVYPHQMVAEVDNNWNLIKRYDPVYGFNGNDVGKNSKHEKNFLWWRHDNAWHLIYIAAPHTVARFDDNFKVVEHTCDYWDYKIWNYGEIRGGTPPILHNGEYYTFFHSSTPFNKTKNQYHLGCYSFEAKPPFKITQITLNPLLSGSKFDGGLPDKPPCIFACGASIKHDAWLITFGVNDIKCGYAYISHDKLIDQMIEL